jgi:multiple sugar transport system permease protein
MAKSTSKKTFKFNAKLLSLYVCLSILVLFFLIPIVGIALSSLKPTVEIARGQLWNLNSGFTTDNYQTVFDQSNLTQYIINTFLVTIPATFLSIALSILTGYVFSKMQFPGSNGIFIIIVAGMFFPPQILLIPLFKLFNFLGLNNTLWPMIIVHTAMGLSICTLLLRNFFTAIPNSLRESAHIEGANELQILLKVFLPISLPALAVLATLQFTWIWNDFLWPLIFTQTDDKRTIMLGLVSLKGQYSVAWGTQGAMALVASIPTLTIFLFFQRYFIHGMTMGAVKG